MTPDDQAAARRVASEYLAWDDDAYEPLIAAIADAIAQARQEGRAELLDILRDAVQYGLNCESGWDKLEHYRQPSWLTKAIEALREREAT